jgi:CubicO group peptidase (beta-lactamase class C family)
MKRPILHSALVAASLVAAGCSSTISPSDPTDIGSWAVAYDVPGAAVAVIRDFDVAYVEVHGVMDRATEEPVTERTLFQAASLTKSVSASGVLSLAQEHAVDLDTDVNEYLSSWKVPYNDLQRSEHVTLRRLLSHTAGTTVSGFRGYRYTEPVPTLLQVLTGAPPANSPPVVVDLVPGTEWRYSGGGYEIADLVVRDVTGLSFPDFIREQVLAPVGIAHSTFEQPLPDSLRHFAPTGHYADGTPVPGGHHIYPEIAAAALWTTAEDMARFLIEVQRSLRGEANRVLDRSHTELLVTEVMNNYGLGLFLWRIEGQPYFGHYGANDGFRSRMVAHLSGGWGAVVLTNSDRGHEFADAVIGVIGEREGWPGF